MEDALRPWAERHAEWRNRGNRCLECERIERGLDRAPSRLAGWASRALAGSGSWLGFQPPVLSGGPRVEDRGSRSWSREPDPAPRPRDPRSLNELRRAAEKLELKIEGNRVRGAAQNPVTWALEQERLEALVRETWDAYYERLYETPVQSS